VVEDLPSRIRTALDAWEPAYAVGDSGLVPLRRARPATIRSWRSRAAPNANTIRAPRRVRLSPGKASGSAVTSRGGVPSTINRLFDRADFDSSWLMTVE
jgi:hypothetical protein